MHPSLTSWRNSGDGLSWRVTRGIPIHSTGWIHWLLSEKAASLMISSWTCLSLQISGITHAMLLTWVSMDMQNWQLTHTPHQILSNYFSGQVQPNSWIDLETEIWLSLCLSFQKLQLDQASLGMPDRSYLLRGLNDSAVAGYYKLMVESAVMLGAQRDRAEKDMFEGKHHLTPSWCIIRCIESPVSHIPVDTLNCSPGWRPVGCACMTPYQSLSLCVIQTCITWLILIGVSYGSSLLFHSQEWHERRHENDKHPALRPWWNLQTKLFLILKIGIRRQ